MIGIVEPTGPDIARMGNGTCQVSTLRIVLNSLAPRNQEKSTGLRFCRCLIRSIVLVVFSSGPNALAVRQVIEYTRGSQHQAAR